MTTEKSQLQDRLNTLEEALPALVREHPDPADFWPAFAGPADAIVEAAGAEHASWVDAAVESMLAFHGAPDPVRVL